MAAKSKGVVRKIKQTARWTLGAILVGHLATAAAYFGNNVYHRVNPSPLRTDFQKQYGVRLEGWSEDVEENRTGVARLAWIIDREQREEEFKLDSIGFRSEGYLKKGPYDQAATICCNTSSGDYNLILSHIAIAEPEDVSLETVTHEIKHAKVSALTDKEELLRKWNAQATDEQGNSLYFTNSEVVFDWVRGLGRFVDPKKQNREENLKLGFISNYARTQVHEDIAELCEAAESEPDQFKYLLFGEQRNEKIAAKVALAEEYRLLPTGFTEYVKLRITGRQSLGSTPGSITEKVPEYLKESELFLEKYPNSIFEADIRSSRAFFFATMGGKKNLQIAISENNSILNASHKSPIPYSNALDRLASLHSALSDDKKAMIFTEAGKEYGNRFKEGRIDITKIGVNDFLEQRGINLQN